MFRVALLVATVVVQVPRGTSEITLNDTTLSVEYGRPLLKGRDMLGQAPVGTVWRLGADQSTTMSVTGSAIFINMVVAKGEYSLFLKRTSETQWSLIVNKQTGQWGTGHDPQQDLLGISLKWEKQDDPVEQLTIELTEETEETGILSIAWGQEVLKQRFRLSP